MELSVVIASRDEASLARSLAPLAAHGAEIIVQSVDGAAFSAFDAGARRARGRYLLFLEGGAAIEAESLDRLCARLREEKVGIVVPTICDDAGRIVAAGRILRRTRMSRFACEIVALRAGEPFAPTAAARDVTIATATCLLVERALFEQLGGFGPRFADALGDVDLSLRALARDLRIVCTGDVAATIGPAHRGSDDPLRLAAARARLETDWRTKIDRFIAADPEVRETRAAPERYLDQRAPRRPITVFVHGRVADLENLRSALEQPGAPIDRVLWNVPSAPPALNVPIVVAAGAPTTAARAAMELRGDRAVAFLDAGYRFGAGWLGALVRELSWGSDVVAATFVSQPSAETVSSCDARASLVALADIPQHLRLDERLPLDDAVAALIAALRPCGLATRAVEARAFAPDVDREPRPLAVERDASRPPEDGLASIIMLSWNAPNYTKIALDSIRAHTRHPHEIIIVDNGSGPETTDWLRTLDDVRVIFNPTNLGFAGGNNVGIAAARGEYIVILNNDVVVTEGWLEGLIDALRRNPLTGISAPRSNRVAGAQLVVDANYADVETMHRYAAARRAKWRKTGFYVDRAIGFCLCIDRRVIDEIGGIDERFGAGNFEDDDFCLRARAAGYKIYVCDDVFIHHFGSVSFAANKVDWQASMFENWKKFAEKWGLGPEYPVNGYQPQPAIARGFERPRDYVALPAAASAEAPAAGRRDARVRFVAVVRDESDWSDIAAFVRRFARAFDADAEVTLEIAACGTLGAALLGERVVRLLERNGLDPATVAEIGLDDVGDALDAWLDELRPALLYRIQEGAFANGLDGLSLVEETSPSALRRIVNGLAAGV